jgi:mono/diheme cytochrome c family protein
MKTLSLALALAAAFAFGCGSSDSSTPAAAADAGSTPSTDSGTTPVADAGSAPVTDAGGAACTTKTYANFGQSFFQTNCNGCHAVTSPRFTTLTAIRANLALCKSEITNGTMPQGRALSTQEKADVLEWLNCNAP